MSDFDNNDLEPQNGEVPDQDVQIAGEGPDCDDHDLELSRFEGEGGSGWIC